MKMTPEQKAFRDYGMALGELKRLRKEVIYNLAHYRGIKKNGAILIFRKCLCERDVLIKEAWQKRAVCRRTCGQCIHFSPNEWDVGKDGCLKRGWGVKTNRCAIGCQYWEPRKEEEAANAAGENTDVNPHNSLINAPAQVGETLADGKEGR